MSGGSPGEGTPQTYGGLLLWVLVLAVIVILGALKVRRDRMKP